MLNKKAHMDPLCLIPTVLVVAVGVFLFTNIGRRGPPEYLLVAFAVIALASQLVHLASHGLNPIAGAISLIIIVISLFLLKFAFGNPTELGEFYYHNLYFIVPSVVVLDTIKTLFG